MSQITFITGNQNKADYLAQYLSVDIAHTKLDLDELQSRELSVVIEHKARQAYELIGTPVLAEDVSTNAELDTEEYSDFQYALKPFEQLKEVLAKTTS